MITTNDPALLVYLMSVTLLNLFMSKYKKNKVLYTKSAFTNMGKTGIA